MSQNRPPSGLAEAIIEHWRGRADLQAIVLDLRSKGRPLEALTAEDLAPHDQLHAGGLEATRLFMDWAAVAPDAEVLDLGAGLGGAARLMASTRGCRVVALDLSPALTSTGKEITGWVGLSNRVTHLTGELGGLPSHAKFDLLWLQHLDIHLPDKEAFYNACREHLAPRGRMVWHDWLAGPGDLPRYPLPWSPDGAVSFLANEADFRALVTRAGWRLTRFDAQQDRTLAWYQKLERALGRALSGGPLDEARRAKLEALLLETRSVLCNLTENRLLPFFGEATARI